MAPAVQWRGLSSDPECQHEPCRGNEPSSRCLFSKAPVFYSPHEQADYVGACLAFPSNEALDHHGTSLLVTWRQGVETQILRRRAALLATLGPARAARCREFIVNKRDAPLNIPGELKVLSQYVAVDSSDLSMPNLEDYRRCFAGARFGSAGAVERGLPEVAPWEARKACAVFRGSASGGGITVRTNPRLRLCALSRAWEHGSNTDQLLDAKLTSWNQRQKLGPDGVVRILDPRSIHPCLDVGKHNYLSWEEQRCFKYAVYVDGNVGAGRLGTLLALGFVILAPASRSPATFLLARLRPWTHFVPLREDLSDLRDHLVWLRQNDSEARAISERNVALHRETCTRQAIEQAMRDLCSPLLVSSEEHVARALAEVWLHHRSAIYVLLDDELRLLIFAPFCNAKYKNEGQSFVTEEPTMKAFLAKVFRLTGARILLPTEQWWTNGSLICNQPVVGSWGESMLPELRLLLERLHIGADAGGDAP